MRDSLRANLFDGEDGSHVMVSGGLVDAAAPDVTLDGLLSFLRENQATVVPFKSGGEWVEDDKTALRWLTIPTLCELLSEGGPR